MDDLSPRQQAILEFIRAFTDENGYPPSIREIGKDVGISSTSVVNYNLNVLEQRSYIERQRDISRGIRLAPDAEEAEKAEPSLQIPLVGVIVAGYPVPVPDSDFAAFDEAISVTHDIVRGDTKDVYALRVQGDSMIDALINDRDIVIVKRQQEVRNGDMVAAWLKEEKETTLKYFYWEERDNRRMIRLQPANPAFEPIIVHPSNLEVQGKVVAVVRQVA